MDMQYKIKLMAEQQGEVMKDLGDFFEGQRKKDAAASQAAKEFDPSSVVLPGIRGSHDSKQDAEYRKQAANQLFKERKYKQALEIYREILQTYSELDAGFLASVHFNVALCEQKTKAPDSVVLESLSKAVELNPDYTKARVQRARAYMRLQRWQDALDDFYASGRDQEAIQGEIQTCIQNLPGQRVQFEDSSESSEEAPVEDAAKAPEPKADDNMARVAYEPNYAIPDGDTGQFYTKIREFERHPGSLAEFLAQFHSGVLAQHLEALEGRLTLVELEAVVRALLGGAGDFSPAKRVNALYQILQVRRYRDDLQFASDAVLRLATDFAAGVDEGALTDVQRERLAAVRAQLGGQ